MVWAKSCCGAPVVHASSRQEAKPAHSQPWPDVSWAWPGSSSTSRNPCVCCRRQPAGHSGSYGLLLALATWLPRASTPTIAPPPGQAGERFEAYRTSKRYMRRVRRATLLHYTSSLSNRNGTCDRGTAEAHRGSRWRAGRAGLHPRKQPSARVPWADGTAGMRRAPTAESLAQWEDGGQRRRWGQAGAAW